jgi:chaperonin cofactor prefoldin
MDKMKSLKELKQDLEALLNKISYLEDRQGFAPRELKAESWKLEAEIASMAQ